MLKRFVRMSLASMLFLVTLHIGLSDIIDKNTLDSVVEYKNAAVSFVSL